MQIFCRHHQKKCLCNHQKNFFGQCQKTYSANFNHKVAISNPNLTNPDPNLNNSDPNLAVSNPNLAISEPNSTVSDPNLDF